MSDFAKDRTPLVERIRSIRGSLRGARTAWADETPVEEYERRRFEEGFDGTERLAGCLLAWLATHDEYSVVARNGATGLEREVLRAEGLLEKDSRLTLTRNGSAVAVCGRLNTGGYSYESGFIEIVPLAAG